VNHQWRVFATQPRRPKNGGSQRSPGPIAALISTTPRAARGAPQDLRSPRGDIHAHWPYRSGYSHYGHGRLRVFLDATADQRAVARLAR